MISKQMWATELTANDSAAQEELGSLRLEYDATYGFRMFRYVGVASDTTVAAGTPLCYTDRKCQTASSDISDGSQNQVCGVGIGAITASYYGWVQVIGYHGGVITNGGDDITDQDYVYLSTTDGQADSWAFGTACAYPTLGVAVADDVNGDNTVSTYLNCM